MGDDRQALAGAVPKRAGIKTGNQEDHTMQPTVSIRGYRPSRFGLEPERTEEAIEAKERSIRLYARLVRKGMSLFEADGAPDRADQGDGGRGVSRGR